MGIWLMSLVYAVFFSSSYKDDIRLKLWRLNEELRQCKSLKAGILSSSRRASSFILYHLIWKIRQCYSEKFIMDLVIKSIKANADLLHVNCMYCIVLCFWVNLTVDCRDFKKKSNLGLFSTDLLFSLNLGNKGRGREKGTMSPKGHWPASNGYSCIICFSLVFVFSTPNWTRSIFLKHIMDISVLMYMDTVDNSNDTLRYGLFPYTVWVERNRSFEVVLIVLVL